MLFSRSYQPRNSSGFTFLDLLATVLLAGLLLLLLFLTVAAARPNASMTTCLNNMRQLSHAWRMYSDDFSDSLVVNYDGGNTGQTGSPSWAGGWLDFSTSPDNTNVAKLLDHSRYPNGAYLGPYLKAASAFKCPSDLSVVTIVGQQLPRARSVSLNEYLGGSRTWTSGSRYELYKKMTQINSPAKIFTFVDERADSLSDACFLSDPDTAYQMIDYPGSYHEGAGMFSFVDGHGSVQRWQDPRTTPGLVYGGFLQLNVNLPGNTDVTWIQQHASELK